MALWLSSWSQPTLDAAYRVGGWLSIVAAGIALIAGVVTVFVGNERDRRSGDADASRDLRAGVLQLKVSSESSLREQLAKDLEAAQAQAKIREQIAEQRERERDATIASLRTELAEATIRTEGAERRASEAERHVANATTEQRPRELSAEQRAAFLSVAKAGPKGRLQFATVAGDREVPYYAEQLLSLLKEAGWEIAGTTIMADIRGYGLFIVGRAGSAVTPAMKTLVEALGAAGDRPKLEVQAWAPDGYPQLLVGYRPIARPSEKQ